MKLRLALTFLCLLLTALGAAAQTADLPSELFVLTNEGIIERYGVNAVGATPVTPEDIYVIDFGLDALGERLAYRTESGITLLGLTGGSGVPLEGATASDPTANMPAPSNTGSKLTPLLVVFHTPPWRTATYIVY